MTTAEYHIPADGHELSLELIEGDREPVCCEALRSDDIKDEHWRRYSHQESPDVFAYHKTFIAHDGGLADVSVLLYPMQYVYALAKLGGVIVNCYVIAATDVPILLGTASDAIMSASKGFLATTWISAHLLPQWHNDLNGIKLIHAFELCYMGWCVMGVLFCILMSCNCIVRMLARVNGRSKGLTKWTFVYSLFWYYFQELVSFSTMKLLYYVTPTIFATHIFNEIIDITEMLQLGAWDKCLAVFRIFSYLFSRIVFLIIGFDTFLVKLRITAHYATAEVFEEASLYGALMCLVFLFQILGVVQLAAFLQERFHIYLFGGKDGQLDHDEKMLVQVWQALLARKIMKTLGIVKGTIVMLGFDDYDFQSLTLDDDAIAMRKAEQEDRLQRASMAANAALAESKQFVRSSPKEEYKEEGLQQRNVSRESDQQQQKLLSPVLA